MMPWCPGCWMGWLFPGFFLLFMLLVMLMMLFRFRWMGGCCGMGMHGGDEALEILRRRFASGEINQQEFEERSRTLRPK